MYPRVVIGDEVLMPPRNGLITLKYRSNPRKLMLPKWLKFYNMKYREPLRECWDESPICALDGDESPLVISSKE